MTAANARRCPASAQRGIPGVPRPTHCRMPARPPRPKAPDPIEPDAPGAFEAPRGGHGARRPKAAPERAGITASERRTCRTMRGSGLPSARSGRAPKGGGRPVQPPSAENVPARPFDGHAPRTRVAAAFPNAAFPLAAVEAFHGDGGPGFCDGDVDAPLSAFGIGRSASRPGNPYDNAVVESTNRALKRELVRGRAFPSEDRLGTGLFDWVNRHSNYRPHSTLGYMTPAGFREAGLILP